jgi:hypothetical protein
MLGAALAAVLGCAACGGSHAQARVVRSHGFSFQAPHGWRTADRGTTFEVAAPEGPELLWVTRLRLLRPYRPALWDGVVPELDRVARSLAAEVSGRVTSSRTVVVAGRRARRYEIRFERNGAERVEQIAFVLDGSTEYQLLCRLGSSGGDVCARFFASFALA